MKAYRLSELSQEDVLDIVRARETVFIEEQQIQEADVDDYDKQAYHLCDWSESGQVRAYARIVDKGTHVSFGRVLVPKNYRGQGRARQLVATAIQEAQRLYPEKPLIIGAQSYLLDFYQSFGFEEISEEYLEVGIPHIDLKYRCK